MTNFGALAILAELRRHDTRLRTMRAVSLLIALETFPAGPDGWREVGTDELCERAALSRNTLSRARDEMTGAKLIEYQPGTHRGDRSRWRINFPVDEPPPKKVPTQGGHLKKVPTQGGHLPGSEGTHTRPEKVPTPGRERYPHPNQAETPPPGALASADAAEGAPPAGAPSGRAAALEPSALEPSALSRAASDPRLILGELTRGDRRLTELIISWFGDEGVRGEALATRLLHLVGEGKGDSLVRWARRALAEQDPDYARTQGPRRAPPCPDCGRPYSPEQLADDEFYRLAMDGDAGCTHKAPP